ncbi:hypothetical protein RJ634_006124 [Pseudomonas aeruginosa]|nr:hypothetical protein [Pseudomonas aeruginosa]
MTRSALSNIAYEALVRARRKFSNREERCIRETWTAEQELVLLRLYPELKSAIRVISKLKRTIQEVEHEEQD